MGTIKFESIKETGHTYKVYFTSYLRQDFVEKSVVISLSEDFVISNIYISSYDFGSLEWINGIGLTECRKWETEEQSESPGYLTRRYTARISNGYAPEGYDKIFLIPDVLNSMEDKNIMRILKSVLKVQKSKKKIIPEKYGFNLNTEYK